LETSHCGRKQSRTSARRIVYALCLLGVHSLYVDATTCLAAPADDWRVPASRARFTLVIKSGPSFSSAGVIAILPDGGILPGRNPRPVVLDSEGHGLKHAGLWHNPEQGLALVFEAPTDGQPVTVYVVDGKAPYPGPPSAITDFTPGVLFYGRDDRGSLQSAYGLATSRPIGPQVDFAVVSQIFDRDPPVGRLGQNSTYYLGWIPAARPGRTYFYTISQAGSEIRLDGTPVHAWPAGQARAAGAGATEGKWMDVSEGTHRLEYFQFNPTPAREVHLGWQLPGAEKPYQVLNDASGVPHKSKYLNRDITGPMQAHQFARSGHAEVTKAESPAGPLAVFEPTWRSYMQPYGRLLCDFSFKADLAETHPKGATYHWQLGRAHAADGPSATRLYLGRDDQVASLTIRHGDHVSTCMRRFFPKHLPRLWSMMDANSRSEYRKRFLADAKNATSERPASTWTAERWQALRSISEIGRGQTLVYLLFTKSHEDILKLDHDTRWYFEEIFIDALSRLDDLSIATTWIKKLEAAERDRERKIFWKVQLADHYLYALSRPQLARKTLSPLNATQRPESAEWMHAMVRIGDIDLLSGDVDRAREQYVWVSRLPHRKRLPAARPKPLAREDAEAEAQAPEATRAPGRLPRTPARSLDWRTETVREGTLYKNFRKLMDDGDLELVREILELWEVEFPLSRLDGEYTVAHAEYLVATRRYARAQQILESYRKAVGMTLYLTKAMEMELRCLYHLKRTDEFKDLARELIDNFAAYPESETARSLLKSYDPR